MNIEAPKTEGGEAIYLALLEDDTAMAALVETIIQACNTVESHLKGAIQYEHLFAPNFDRDTRLTAWLPIAIAKLIGRAWVGED